MNEPTTVITDYLLAETETRSSGAIASW